MGKKEFKKYFFPSKPVGAISLLILGFLILLVCALTNGTDIWFLIGIIALFSGGFLLKSFFNHQTGHIIDQFCNKQAEYFYDTKQAIVVSYGKTVLDTITSSGYCFENLFSARKAVQGHDGVLRSSIFEMTGIFFTEKQVYFFSKKISLITDEKMELENIFSIKDVQMISLKEINQSVVVVITIPGNERLYFNCQTRTDAINLCQKLKTIVNTSS